MAITPLFMCGAEFARGAVGNPCTEFDNPYTEQPLCIGSFHTGAHCLDFYDTSSLHGHKVIPATRQFRVGMWVYFNGDVADLKDSLLEWMQADGTTHIGWFGIDSAATNKFAAYVGDHTTAPVETSTDVYAHSQWYNVCLDVKVHSTDGWIYVWQDGVNVISFDGNTGNADVGQIILGSCAAANASTEFFADDFYLDDTTGEAAPSIPPDRRLYPIYPNGAGTYAEGLAKGGGASSSTQVDDGYSSDQDTTYNYVDALDERETYAATTFVQPVDSTIYAVQVKAHALKTDAGTDTEIALMQRGGAAAADYEDAASQNLAGDWLLYAGDIRLLDPAGQPWAIAQIDSLEIGFRGKGAF